MKHVAFFGDGEHTFALPFELISELERKTGFGIGVIYNRVRALSFSLSDIIETIRLALIGGGAKPEDAFALVQTYVAKRPLSENIPLVFAILDCVWFGSPADDKSATDEANNG